MPELPDSHFAPHTPMQSRCPMCGAECEAEAEDCAECGEVFQLEQELDLLNERTLREQIRALTAMHVLVGIFLLAIIKFFFDTRFDLGAALSGIDGLMISVGSFLLAAGHIVVAWGVFQRNMVALRLSIFFSIVTMVLSLWTVCLFILSLLLIAGINQAHRISKLIREQRAQESVTQSPS
ncbi:MAG TPA: hypothetical protein VMM56_02475 [Planctomycetaceae bacterium]|nr:hypothetical protein [Planctomycetaceae bacterium]